MRRFTLLTFLLFAFLGAFAQSISVKSFKALPMDMTASSLEGKRIDQNGQVAALIKVMTTETGFVFEGGTLGIVDTQQRVGEIWVWVPRASRKITILHQQLGGLRDYRYPIEIESERTYEMVLTTAKIETVIKEAVTQQFLTFQISPANAMLEVDGKLWEVDSDGTATKFVDFGTYNYRVQAPNYQTEVGKVTVNDPDNAHKVPVILKSDLVSVTLQVDADAEIWINNEKKGIRTWTGALGKGTYKIECKQANHENTLTTQKITADMDGQTITLPAPTPIYGSLIIESMPNYATIYLDGNAIGETPKFVKEILVGEHDVKLTKEGRLDYEGTVTISRGEQQQIKAQLEKDGTAPEVTNDVQEEQVVVAPKTTVNLEKPVAKSGFRKKGFVMRPDLGIGVYPRESVRSTSFTSHLSMGFQFGPHFYLGGSIGYDGTYIIDDHYKYTFFPLIGLDSRWYILNRNWTPIVGLELGTALYYGESPISIGFYDVKLKAGCAYKNWEMTFGMQTNTVFIIDLSYRFSFSSSKAGK